MITIENLDVNLPNFSLENINLQIDEGDFFTLLGPTGSGKSVLLETIAGLIPVSSGSIKINRTDITHTAPEKRGLSIVYQDYALFPHLSVKDNITFGARYKNIEKIKADKKAHELAEMLNISHLLDRTPRNLSGGEKQRASIARALLVDPAVLLLDEPLSALDPAFRQEVQDLLKSIHRETGITFVMVTHDFDEALYLATNGAIIKNGKLIRKGLIRDIFNTPGSEFVANFVGMTNIYVCSPENGCMRSGELSLQCEKQISNEKCHMAFRPEEIILGNKLLEQGHPNCFEAVIKTITVGGFHARVTLDYAGIEINALVPRNLIINGELETGSKIKVSIPPKSIHLF
ncbi:tungstate/molybdate transport system ATP-binding protein [Maridesulfovibrio ferrireducens]|uniref:Tungstate/molybdate transport system ATP-binding protein n=1 Tax=Maridesulfovibrio ferrireducens TaxID=246191 RepID=A0A1G9FXR2_9BACT|nr:ATP-binding cassette domain-containing protein [Maridesulfovibrio ferrireducens]SDK92963.1 tungstate/molybdate transport system ATP-binding protein [Maridesulfovibrio ferrireducens]